MRKAWQMTEDGREEDQEFATPKPFGAVLETFVPFRGNYVIVNSRVRGQQAGSPPRSRCGFKAGLPRRSRCGFKAGLPRRSRCGEGGSRSVKVSQTDCSVKLSTQISHKHLNMNALQNKQPWSDQTRLNLVNAGMILPDVPGAAGQI
jgi:hypothetical protein